MLSELRIENFAIINQLELTFADGLVIVTGETGAGKSILLDAIMALVGGRVDVTMVRSGADRAVLEAVFKLPEETRAEVQAILSREELDEGEPYVTLGREIRAEGRTVARVNGRNVNVGLLKELGIYLVDIHGQAEHLSLLDVRSHLGFLDRFAADENELAAYKSRFQTLSEIRRELHAVQQMEQEAAKKTELLNFQAQEIEAASLKEGEDADLEQERSRLANAESLSASAQQALALLDEGNPESPAITDLFGQVVQQLNALSRVDSSRQALTDQGDAIASQISDICRDLRIYLDEIEFNPHRLEQVENRLEMIHQLKRKYGATIPEIVAFGGSARAQLETIEHAQERIEELSKAEEEAQAALREAAEALSAIRKAAGNQLGHKVETELDDLSMKGARFSTSVEYSADEAGIQLSDGQKVAFDSNGVDRVEFMIAPNPGEGLKPLVKIASGGETSRLMLALKNVLADADYVPTLIFDEIDQGIGGRVGSVVGEKLWNLARNHQVMCVTHLPQLASFGDQHFHVRKLITEGRTMTEVEKLDDNGRIVELAAMTGSVSESNLNSARELLVQAKQRQKELLAL
jgi:DNA repair protein RecN (Recombination protein N)